MACSGVCELLMRTALHTSSCRLLCLLCGLADATSALHGMILPLACFVLISETLCTCLQDVDTLGAWLDGLGCHNGGLLQRCWELHAQTDLASQQQQQQQQPAYSDGIQTDLNSAAAAQAVNGMWLPSTVDELQQAWGMSDITLVPAWRLGPDCGQLQPAASWRQYYDLRQLPQASPAGRSISNTGLVSCVGIC
jgi:hypothetical protein